MFELLGRFKDLSDHLPDGTALRTRKFDFARPDPVPHPLPSPHRNSSL